MKLEQKLDTVRDNLLELCGFKDFSDEHWTCLRDSLCSSFGAWRTFTREAERNEHRIVARELARLNEASSVVAFAKVLKDLSPSTHHWISALSIEKACLDGSSSEQIHRNITGKNSHGLSSTLSGRVARDLPELLEIIEELSSRIDDPGGAPNQYKPLLYTMLVTDFLLAVRAAAFVERSDIIQMEEGRSTDRKARLWFEREYPNFVRLTKAAIGKTAWAEATIRKRQRVVWPSEPPTEEDVEKIKEIFFEHTPHERFDLRATWICRQLDGTQRISLDNILPK